MHDSIVIGAGHNGLIAACYLAMAGRRPLVLERRDIVGGACVTEEVWPGYRISVGAYLCSLLLPDIVRDLRLADYGYEVYRRDPAGFAPARNGPPLFMYADPERTRRSLLAACTPADADALVEFEADVARAAGIMEAWFGPDAPTDDELKRSFDLAGCRSLYEQFVTGSVRDLLDARFQSDRLKALLATDGLIGTYGGPSTPGTAYVLLHHYLGRAAGSRGAWGYVRGGMGAITQALAARLVDLGGEIRTGAPVARLLLWEEAGRNRVCGVELESGEQLSAPLVLSNADPHVTFNRLLSEHARPAPGPWESLTTRGGASAKINLAVSELPVFTCLPPPGSEAGPRDEHLGTVHLCSSMDALERAWQDAAEGRPSTEPMIEMYIQTATDSSLTPPGRHILSLFVQYFPYHLAPGLELEAERESFADRVLQICGTYAPNIPGSILERQVLTPRDLESRFGLTGGHIFHGDLLPPNLFSGRCRAQTHIEGLFLCGSGAHPGGCVFGAPGRNAAMAALKKSNDEEEEATSDAL